MTPSQDTGSFFGGQEVISSSIVSEDLLDFEDLLDSLTSLGVDFEGLLDSLTSFEISSC